MKTFFVVLSALSAFPIANYRELNAADTMTVEDKATAESARDAKVEALERDLENKDAALRQARRQRSPQMQALLKQVQDAKKELATARRKPLEDYLAEARRPAPPANKPDAPMGVDGERPAVAKGLTVILPYTKAYIPQGEEVFDFNFVLARFDGETHTQGFFQVDGKAERLSATSSDRAVLKIVPSPESIVSPFSTTFRKAGKATITVTAGGYEVQQEVEVVEIPVRAKASSAEVIEGLGLPTTKKPVFVDWPNTKTVDCFIYSPDAGRAFVGEHWTYEKYPSLMLSITNGNLHKVGTLKKDNATRAEVSIPEPNAGGDGNP